MRSFFCTFFTDGKERIFEVWKKKCLDLKKKKCFCKMNLGSYIVNSKL